MIWNGQLDLACTGDGYADLLLRLRFNGTAVASDHGHVSRTGSSTTCVVNDADVGVLGSYLSTCSGPTSVSGAPGSYSLNVEDTDDRARLRLA